MATNPLYNNVRRRYGCDENGTWYLEITVTDTESRQHRKIFSMAALAKGQKDLLEFLGAAGFVITHEQRKLLHQLLSPPTKSSFRVLTQQGWNLKLFATPYRIYGGRDKRVRALQSEAVLPNKWKPIGTLKDWKEHVGSVCTDNPLLMFAVCAAFAPPLLKILALPSAGFSFVGDPALGKSTLLTLAGSVWGGDPDRRLGFCETFLKTPNAADKLIARYRDSCLCLDEMRLAATKMHDLAENVGAMVHRLSGGQGKETAIESALPAQGSLIYVFSSNHQLRQIFSLAQLPFDESYSDRLIEIPVEGPGGLFHRVPKGSTGHDFAQRVLTGIRDNYGTPIDKFLERLTRDWQKDDKTLEQWLRHRMASMAKRLHIDGNARGVGRKAQYFCLVYAAARLAQKYGILAWNYKALAQAVSVAYTAHRHLESAPDPGADRVGAVRDYLRTAKASLIDVSTTVRQLSDEHFQQARGFVAKSRDGESYFLLSPRGFRSEFGAGDNGRATLEALKAKKLLRHDKGKLLTKHRIRSNKDRDRVYSISARILDL